MGRLFAKGYALLVEQLDDPFHRQGIDIAQLQYAAKETAIIGRVLQGSFGGFAVVYVIALHTVVLPIDMFLKPTRVVRVTDGISVTDYSGFKRVEVRVARIDLV